MASIKNFRSIYFKGWAIVLPLAVALPIAVAVTVLPSKPAVQAASHKTDRLIYVTPTNIRIIPGTSFSHN